MIYLDIVTIYSPEEKITCRGDIRLFEQKQVAKRFMRVRDDRFPGEEMLIPLEEVEEDLKEAKSPFELEDEPKQLGQAPLLESLV